MTAAPTVHTDTIRDAEHLAARLEISTGTDYQIVIVSPGCYRVEPMEPSRVEPLTYTRRW